MIYNEILKIAGYCEFHRTNGLYITLDSEFDEKDCPACNNIAIKKVLFEKEIKDKCKTTNMCTLIEINL